MPSPCPFASRIALDRFRREERPGIGQDTDKRGRAGRQDGVCADTSPASRVPIGVKQMVVTGSLDRLVPAVFARGYADKVKAAGDDAPLLEISGAGHFELIDPTSQAWKRRSRNKGSGPRRGA